MKIAIIGGSGLLGQSLTKCIDAEIISRSGPVTLDTLLTKEYFTSFDIIINLTGRSIDAWRWTKTIKQDIVRSRCDVIRKLSQAAMQHNHHPWLIQASGQSYYGLFKEHLHIYSEQDPPEPSDTFMQDVAFEIENACKSYPGQLTKLRIAPVLDRAAGVFPKLMMLSQWGCHLIPGDGQQMFSWIAIEDWQTAIQLIIQDRIYGAVNIASPGSIRFEEMYTCLQTVYGGFKMKIPGIFYQITLGELSQLLLLGNHTTPQKLINHNMSFRYKTFLEFCQQHR